MPSLNFLKKCINDGKRTSALQFHAEILFLYVLNYDFDKVVCLNYCEISTEGEFKVEIENLLDISSLSRNLPYAY